MRPRSQIYWRKGGHSDHTGQLNGRNGAGSAAHDWSSGRWGGVMVKIIMFKLCGMGLVRLYLSPPLIDSRSFFTFQLL